MQEINSKRLVGVRSYTPEIDSTEVVDVTDLRIIHDSAAALLQVCKLGNESESRYLAESLLQTIRVQIRSRYNARGVPIPPYFHKASCGCPTCRPVDLGGDEHA